MRRERGHVTMVCEQRGATIEEALEGSAPWLPKRYLTCPSVRRRRGLKYIWLGQHDAFMRAHYYGGLQQRGRVISALMRRTGFPRWYIKRQAQRLGLTMHQDRRRWTQQELDTLDNLLGKVSTGAIAKRLKRTESSVVMKIKALGHSRRVREGYTMRDLEECLGEDHRKIQKWIANGWLHSRPQGTQRHNSNGHDIHRFHEKDILAFIKQHPQELNLGKVEQLWFLDLVLLKGKEL
ncbi:MAG TPA: hypothetical protein VG028_18290 [Terriglobia bacterium]|nr:hypothetical protein [Terriglobia bacterium]